MYRERVSVQRDSVLEVSYKRVSVQRVSLLEE